MLSDPRRFSRIVAAVALILAPIITLAGMLATPWEDEATTASYHDALAAHPGQAGIAALLLHFGYLLLLPAALGIMHLARRSTPKVAHIGGILAVIGLATLPGLLVTDYYDLALAQNLPRAAVGRDRRRRRRPAGPRAVLLATTIAPMFFGLVTLLVAAFAGRCRQVLGADRGRRRLDPPVRLRHRARPGGRRRDPDRRRAARRSASRSPG